MTWRTLRRQPPPAPSADLEEARRVRVEAEATLARAKQHGQRVDTLAESLRTLRRRNHIVEGIKATLVGGSP